MSLKKLYKFKTNQDEKIKKEGLLPLFKALRVEGTVKSGINRDDIKTDILIERKK